MSLKLVTPLRASKTHGTSSNIGEISTQHTNKSSSKSSTKSRNKSTTKSSNNNDSKGEKERQSKSKSKSTKTTKKINSKSKRAKNTAPDIAGDGLLSEGDDLEIDNTPQGPNDNIRSGSNETVASTFMAQYNRPNLNLGFEFELSICV